MAGATAHFAYYLPGGGSSGAYDPDELFDIDKENQNWVALDATLYAVKQVTDALTSTVPIAHGGTGATTQAAAQTALGINSLGVAQFTSSTSAPNDADGKPDGAYWEQVLS